MSIFTPALLQQTVYASLIIQAIVGVVDVYGITLKVPPPNQILIDVLKIETLVQVIQFIGYLYLVGRMNIPAMAADRYKDWFISTPLMLFTTTLFFEYNNQKDKIVTLKEFVATNKTPLTILFVSNFLMLLFGWLGEVGALGAIPANVLGFAAYAFTFWYLYDRYAKHSPANKQLYTFFTIVWGLYGLAYWLPIIQKNIASNGLDIVAKNFFGVYLFYLVYQASLKKKSQDNNQ